MIITDKFIPIIERASTSRAQASKVGRDRQNRRKSQRRKTLSQEGEGS
jgi:hypothetical protein